MKGYGIRGSDIRGNVSISDSQRHYPDNGRYVNVAVLMLQLYISLYQSTYIRRTVQITVGRQRRFRRRLINLMGNNRIYQIRRGQRAVRRWSNSHSWLHWPVTKLQTKKCYKSTYSFSSTLKLTFPFFH